MNSTTTPSRRRARLLTGLTAGAILAIAVPAAASAHIGVTPDTASGGGTSSLTFSFSHGCEESPTTALIFDIPAGIGNVTPVVQGGWTVEREIGSDGIPTQVTFTSDVPVEPGLKASVSMDVLFTEATAGTTVAFPVVQVCAVGQNDWTEVVADGEDESSVDSPAPFVTVGDVVATDSGHGGHGAATADPEDHADASADGDAASTDVVARWLAGGALLAGIAALAVSLLRRRSRG
ncbi:nuclear export factor GLE1 [Microbacterium sp. Root61]|uniref:DUF1775 domain-containing protein n=1 Tax=Microbacterium sp. Root61 TaxID=1736570 RepID=UPI0006F851EF|nr:DUF1775 domain-containing protein [Microbacterium sp. Root61]KRA22368.1 nuclear export factor GLE1 [Microbacterium sp. Root61]